MGGILSGNVFEVKIEAGIRHDPPERFACLAYHGCDTYWKSRSDPVLNSTDLLTRDSSWASVSDDGKRSFRVFARCERIAFSASSGSLFRMAATILLCSATVVSILPGLCLEMNLILKICPIKPFIIRRDRSFPAATSIKS